MGSDQFNETFKNKLNNIHDEKEYRKFVRNEILPLAKEKRYNISENDIVSYDRSVIQSLSEEELENIAGGKNLWAPTLIVSALMTLGGGAAHAMKQNPPEKSSAIPPAAAGKLAATGNYTAFVDENTETDPGLLYDFATKSGDAEKMVRIGLRLEKGERTSKDPKKAFQLYDQTAHLGNADAIFHLGLCYENGIGVDKDMSRAVELYNKAAENGNTDAMYSLALCYENGNEVQKNEIEAFTLYGQASEKNHPEAIYRWCDRYMSLGLFKEPNEKDKRNEDDKRREIFELAALKSLNIRKVFNPTQLHLQVKLEDSSNWNRSWEKLGNNTDLQGEIDPAKRFNPGKVITQLEKAADLGHVDAMYCLGLFYESGFMGEKFILKTPEDAIKLYERSAEQNNTHAMTLLALHYEYGIGVEKNEEHALELYKTASSLGDIDASEQQANLLKRIGKAKKLGEDISMTTDRQKRALRGGNPGVFEEILKQLNSNFNEEKKS